MTGASRFGQTNSHWIYSKIEDLSPDEFTHRYTHLLTSAPGNHSATFEPIFIQPGLNSVRTTWRYPFVSVVMNDTIHLMKHRGSSPGQATTLS